MDNAVQYALEVAESLKAKAEVRQTFIEEEIVRVKNFETEICGYESSAGIGITVYVNGFTGFASTSFLDKDSIRETVNKAYLIARARSELKRQQIVFPEFLTIKDEKISEYKVDPFKVSQEEKIDLLLKINREALSTGKEAKLLPVSMIRSLKKRSIYANTDGAFIKQEFIYCGAEVQVYAFSENELQVRSFPSRDSSYYQGGYEVIENLNLIEGAKIAAEEALELLQAKNPEPGIYDAVISQDQMALQIHESIGHPSEFDRVLGFEISLAGASYLKPEDRNKLELASPIVSIVADATFPGGLGSFYYDDEGTPAQKFSVIEEGVFRNFLTSRESALSLGEPSNGCARAESALKIPIVRMTNLNLLPLKDGPKNLEEMISDIKNGIYLKTTKSWSIDDLRLNFQFAVEYAREIKNGKLGKVVKNASYTGITPNFWKNVVQIGGQETFQLFGFFNCGKGDPIQLMTVGHGSPLVKVKNLHIGEVK